MQKDWNIQEFKIKYLPGTLGYEYALFMENLGFSPLEFNLAKHIPDKMQNFIKLGVKNYDLVHLLFGLYDIKKGSYKIIVFHEWIFIHWEISHANSKENGLLKLLTFPLKFIAFITFKNCDYSQAQKLGQQLAQNSADLNTIFLNPYFDMNIDDVRQKFGIQTLQV